MNEPITIHIIGAPVACAEGVKETWRELAGWIGEKLRTRYGTAVSFAYFDLFDPNCPPLPPDAQLPLVLVNGDVLSSGGKLSMPAIHRYPPSTVWRRWACNPILSLKIHDICH
jgi:disulfide oxidoreductase YuzD